MIWNPVATCYSFSEGYGDISTSNNIYDIWPSRTNILGNTTDNGKANVLHLQHAAQICG